MLGENESIIYGIDAFTIGSGAISYSVDKFTECTTNLTVKVGNVTVATRTNTSGTSAGDYKRTITFSSSELTAIYNAMSKVSKATFLFTLTSYVDRANIGSSSATAIGTLPSTMKPSISSVSLSENVSGIATQFGAFLKNISKLNYTINATAPTGATITSYNLTIDKNTYTTKTGITSVLKNSGTLSYSAYVIDSRGRKSDTKTGTISVLDYNIPQISVFRVIRCDAEGNENNEGLYAKYTVNSSISPVNNKNTKSFVIDYRKNDNGSWSSWTTWKTYTAGYTLNETSAVKAIEDKAYQFRIRATDYFNNPQNKIFFLPSTYVLFELTEDLDGISWGGASAETDTFGIDFTNTKLSKRVYVGKEEDPSEKNMYFPNPSNSQYPHNSKVYGGNATSPVAIGMWDAIASLPIFQYFDGTDYRFKFGDGIKLRWGNYDIEAILEKVSGSLTGQIHYKEGLLIQWGTISIAGGNGTPTSQEITFPIEYDEIPFIVESVVTTVPGTTILGSGHGSDNITGTTLYVNRVNTANTSLRWISIGFKEG